MAEVSMEFESFYCPPLDPALLSAILSDFDLSVEEDITRARETLDTLKESALLEESSAFDPSGTGARHLNHEELASSERALSCPDSFAARAQETDETSVSNGIRSLDLGSDSENDAPGDVSEQLEEVEKLDEGTKLELLHEMFPEASKFSIQHTLKKCSGSWERAMEELLNHAFFETGVILDGDEKIFAKGVEAFSQDSGARRRRRKREKRRSRYGSTQEQGTSSSLPVEGSPNVIEDAWQKGRKDIDFISSRAQIPQKTIAALYHQNGASLPATIIALLSTFNPQNGTSQISSSESDIQAQSLQLGKDFPNVPSSYLVTLIRLTHPSQTAAHELALALTKTPNLESYTGVGIVPQYAPLDLSDDSDDSTSFRSVTGSATNAGKSSSINPATRISMFALARQRALSQASAARRRGKSDHSMTAAAGYYSDLGRDYAVKGAEARAEAADALVNSQSSNATIDLHGVTVKDAVRIVKARTEAWWRTNGTVTGLDGRVTRCERAGLRIVTGLGRHSEGGRGRIGPAVGNMLERDGWRIVFEEGVIVVTGKKRYRGSS